jgi:hypothetical protein
VGINFRAKTILSAENILAHEAFRFGAVYIEPYTLTSITTTKLYNYLQNLTVFHLPQHLFTVLNPPPMPIKNNDGIINCSINTMYKDKNAIFIPNSDFRHFFE